MRFSNGKQLSQAAAAPCLTMVGICAGGLYDAKGCRWFASGKRRHLQVDWLHGRSITQLACRLPKHRLQPAANSLQAAPQGGSARH